MRAVWVGGVMAGLLAAGPMWAAALEPRIPTVSDPDVGLYLWRGAEIGMTVAQVRALFPRAAPPARSTLLTGGEVDLLEVSGIDLEGHPASAHFFFKDAALVSVELTLRDLQAAQSARNVQIATRIAAGFTTRYGGPYDCGGRSLGDVTAYECKWLKSPLSIRLWYMDTAGQAPLFYIAYRQADDPGYDL